MNEFQKVNPWNFSTNNNMTACHPLTFAQFLVDGDLFGRQNEVGRKIFFGIVVVVVQRCKVVIEVERRVERHVERGVQRVNCGVVGRVQRIVTIQRAGRSVGRTVVISILFEFEIAHKQRFAVHVGFDLDELTQLKNRSTAGAVG